MKPMGLFAITLITIGCTEEPGRLKIDKESASPSLTVGTPSDAQPLPMPPPPPPPAPTPTTFPAFVTNMTANSKGATVKLSGPAQAFRFSFDNMITWTLVGGPFQFPDINIPYFWPPSTTQICMQAQGTDGNWYGSMATETHKCIPVTPQWLNQTGLISYFRFDDPLYSSGQTYLDTLKATQGTLTANDSLNKAVTDGTYKAMDFDGVDDSFNIPYNQKFDVTQFSLSLFIKKMSVKLNEWGHIIGRQLGLSFYDSWALAYDNYRNATDNLTYVRSTLDEQSCILYGPADNDFYNQWAHVAITDSGSMIKMYINGTLYASIPCSIPFNYDGAPICVGTGANDDTRQCNSESTAASISEVSIWNRLLSDAEILEIYQHKTLLIE